MCAKSRRSRSRTAKETASSPRHYRGADVPLTVIRRFAREVAQRFEPDKIILFGSHAYGKPHRDSDVDILVIKPTSNQHSLAAKIRLEVPAPFPMDLLVRTPENLRWRLAEGESFHTDIVTHGKVLYEKGDARVGAQSRVRLPARRRHSPRKRPVS